MSAHCGTCSCGTVEYGVTFVGGVKDGETIAPLPTAAICYWNRNWWSTVHLVVRTRPEVKWRRASGDEVDHWNAKIMAPHVLGRA